MLSLVQNIERAVAGDKALPEDAAKFCISAYFFAIMWELQTLEDLQEKKALSDEGVETLKTRLHAFMEACKQLLQDSDSKALKEEVCEGFL